MIPVRHVGSFFELEESDQVAMPMLLSRAGARMDDEFLVSFDRDFEKLVGRARFTLIPA